MAFNISNKEYKEIFVDRKNITRSFLRSIKSYLKSHLPNTIAKDFYDWIDSGNPIAVFSCRTDYFSEMEEELKRSNIPYLRVVSKSGKCGFIVKDCDIRRCRVTIKDLMERKAHYCHLVPVSMMNREGSVGKGQSGKIVCLSNMPKEKANYLRKIIANRMGIDEMGFDFLENGNCQIGIYENDMKRKGYRGDTIPRIILESELLFASPVHENLLYSERSDIEYHRFLHDNLNKEDIDYNKTPVYIVGRSREYIKYTGAGIDFGRIADKGGEPVFIKERSINRIAPDYSVLEASYINRLAFPVSTYALSEAIAYAKSSIQDPKFILNEKKEEIKSSIIAERLDRRIGDQMAYDREMAQIDDQGEWLNAYRLEAAALLIASAGGKTNIRTDEKTVEEIRHLSNEHHLQKETRIEAGNHLISNEYFSKDAHERMTSSVSEILHNEQREAERHRTKTREELGLGLD